MFCLSGRSIRMQRYLGKQSLLKLSLFAGLSLTLAALAPSRPAAQEAVSPAPTTATATTTPVVAATATTATAATPAVPTLAALAATTATTRVTSATTATANSIDTTPTTTSATPAVPSLTPVPSPTPTPRPTPTPVPLDINGIYPRSSGREGLWVQLELDQKVDLASFQSHIEVDPPVANLRVEPDNDRLYMIFGDWVPKTRYRITLTAGLKNFFGGELANPISRTVLFKSMPVYLNFNQTGKIYFPRGNAHNSGVGLQVETRSIPKAELRLARLFPNNIAVALCSMHIESDAGDGVPSENFKDEWCEELGHWSLDLTMRGNRLTTTPLDVRQYLPKDARGVFYAHIEGRSKPSPTPAGQSSEDDEEDSGRYRRDRHSSDDEEEYGSKSDSASKLVLMTNLGLLAHWRDRQLVLFVHDLYSVQPVAGAKVTVWSSKNQIWASGRTDAGGVVFLNDFDGKLGQPYVAVVEAGKDYTFLELTPREEDNKQADQSLSPYDRDAYEGFLYADRTLYRPGDPVHLRWLVRQHYGDAVPGVPLELVITKPNNEALLTRPVTLSDVGTGQLDLPTQKSYATGAYTVTLKLPGKDGKVLGTYTFNIEEFVPSRMKAKLATGRDRWLAGQAGTITVSAQHLFGAPAAGLKSDATMSFEKADFSPAGWTEFHFGNDAELKESRAGIGEEQTGPDGQARFEYLWRPSAAVSFPVTGHLTGRVYEAGGRAVAAKKDMLLFPSPICLGLAVVRSPQPGEVVAQVAAITPITTGTQATNKPTSGTPEVAPAALATVKVTLEKRVWSYAVRRYTSNYESNWSDVWEPLETRDVALASGRGETHFALSDSWGNYRLRVHSDATAQFSTVNFYSYSGRAEVTQSENPQLVHITTDKPSYETGDLAEVTIQAPYDGRALVVIESETIQEAYTVELRDNIARLPLKIKPGYFPGAWVQVTAVHSVSREPLLISPFASFAMAPLPVHDPTRDLKITLPGLPVEVKPGLPAEVTVEVRDASGRPAANAELTLAAVDEGIHLMSNYHNPDPWAWLSRLRRPDLRRAHYYDRVAYDFQKTAAGGDEGDEVGKRLGLASRSWIRTVALWSGVVRTAGDGRAVVRLDLPEFNGQLRLVTVACNARALGAHAANLYVRRPWLLETSQPRFLLPGDAFRAMATLYNNSDATCTAAVTWVTSGTLAGTLAPVRGASTATLPPHGEARFSADLTAGQAIGQGAVRWEALLRDPAGHELERLTETPDIPVNPPAAFQSEHTITVLKPGETRELRNTRFLENEMTETKLMAGGSMLLRLQEALGYVAHYPYGCVEQTTSKLLPLYLLRQATPLTMSALGSDAKDRGRLDDYLRAGIDRLFSMQTAGGGLAFWPGGHEPYSYGSIYALHALTLIRNDRQLDVPAESFASLQNYVRRLVAQDTGEWDLSSLNYQRAYGIYVLTLGGDPDAMRQIQRFDTTPVPAAARYLLAAALALATRDAERVRQYLAKAPVTVWDERQMGETLNSPVRTSAIKLLALTQTGTAPLEEKQRLANELVDWLTANHYGTTQETAFAITALAGYLGGLAHNLDQASIQITDPDGRLRTIAGPVVYTGTSKGPNRVFHVTNTGQTDYLLGLTTRGIPAAEALPAAALPAALLPTTDTSAASHGLAIRRTVLSAPVTTGGLITCRQTDTLIVRLDITCDRAGGAKNVVVADLLPAGFEVENPRLDPDAMPGKKFEDAITPDHLELRDDRLVLAFDKLEPGVVHFYYLVRAVTPGRYQLPPAEVECMYDASVNGHSPAGALEVKALGEK